MKYWFVKVLHGERGKIELVVMTLGRVVSLPHQIPSNGFEAPIKGEALVSRMVVAKKTHLCSNNQNL